MIDILKLRKRDNLIIVGDKICVVPNSRYDFTAYPIEDMSKAITVTLDEYVGLKIQYYRFSDDLTRVVENI